MPPKGLSTGTSMIFHDDGVSTRHQPAVVAGRVQAVGQERGVHRGPPHVEAGNDPEHSDPTVPVRSTRHLVAHRGRIGNGLRPARDSQGRFETPKAECASVVAAMHPRGGRLRLEDPDEFRSGPIRVADHLPQKARCHGAGVEHGQRSSRGICGVAKSDVAAALAEDFLTEPAEGTHGLLSQDDRSRGAHGVTTTRPISTPAGSGIWSPLSAHVFEAALDGVCDDKITWKSSAFIACASRGILRDCLNTDKADDLCRSARILVSGALAGAGPHARLACAPPLRSVDTARETGDTLSS